MLYLIAHRGDNVNAPENTLIAFKMAKEKKVDCVEFDVMLTQDGEAIIIHDETVDRTTNGHGRVSNFTLEEIKTLDAGSWFDATFKNQAIPTLVDTIKFLVNQDLNANIEIKPSEDDIVTAVKTTKKVIQLLHDHWPATKKAPLISSFNTSCLEVAMQLAPEYPRGLLLDEWHDDCCQRAAHFKCQNINLNEECLTLGRVKQIKDAGFIIYAYTVNNVERAQELEQMGVDGIFSDNPELLSLLHARPNVIERVTTATHASLFRPEKTSQSRKSIDEDRALSPCLNSR